MDRHQPEQYSESGFWDSVSRGFKSAGATVVRPALELYYAMETSETPMWAKTIAVGALGYLILPIDAVPDFLPGVGFGDDVVTMMAAITSLGRYVTPDVKSRAERTANETFGL
ncbi:MAG: DUF1232 domain-containing protein [Planctomycetaceae bacterium]|nr:DUF1232 domain-containing protein [Planctomycetaceae bacterium]